VVTLVGLVNTSGTACPPTDGLSICTLVRDATGNVKAGLWAELLLGTPLKIIGVLTLAVAARFVTFRIVDRIVEGIANGRAGLGRLEKLPNATALLTTSPLLSARREQRARTMGSVLKSIITGALAVVTLLMIMQQVGLPTAPLLASAGIVGVALGFGSQALVKDFLSGLFMMAEDQYGVGDVVDLGEASGVVEAVGLRVTRLRDLDGTVWYLRNGEVLRVGNRSQGWARAVLDIAIAYEEAIVPAKQLLLDVAREFQQDEEFAALVMEEPQVWGIESMSAESVVLRLVVKTQPLQQWTVARELRLRIKERFDAEGVRMAYPQAALWVNGNGRGDPEPGDPEPDARPDPVSSK
jgi:small-conductance mechanosensitive channel